MKIILLGLLALTMLGGCGQDTDSNVESLQGDTEIEIEFENGAFATAPEEPPIRVVGSRREWLCDTTISRELRDIVFEETKYVAQINSLPEPDRSLCKFEIGELLGSPSYTISHFSNSDTKEVCEGGGACANLYMMVIASYNGRLARSYTLIGPDSSTTHTACLFWNGEVASLEQNCFQLR